MINVNMTDKAGVTLATAGKYCADNVKVTPSTDILRKDEQAKTATPTTSTQDITPDAGKALSKVTVNPITAAIVGDLDADGFASAIVAAIEGKGVDVPSGAKLDALAALIESIEAGGGGDFATGTFTTTDDITSNIVINHNLGVKPKFIIVLSSKSDVYTAPKPKVLPFFYLFLKESLEKYVCKYQRPGYETAAYNLNWAGDSAVGNSGLWYYCNVDENTFTLKQTSISSTYGIGASSSFFWIAYRE